MAACPECLAVSDGLPHFYFSGDDGDIDVAARAVSSCVGLGGA